MDEKLMDFRLNALCPLDGRYADKVEPLREIFSEKGLMSYRIKVEEEYLIALSVHPGVAHLRQFTPLEIGFIHGLHKLTSEQARIIKLIETRGYEGIKRTKHDVKNIEYYIRRAFKMTSLEDVVSWVHFALTSEDITNIAYALMLRDALNLVLLPEMRLIRLKLQIWTAKYSELSMAARTHGQTAVGTSLGKEFGVWENRLDRQIIQLHNFKILVKLNGAVGNYNAHRAAYPEVNWIEFTTNLVMSFNGYGDIVTLEPNLVTTQIEPHDTYAELFGILNRINTILLDMCEDIWRYVSDDWIVLKAVAEETGSSTMPQKVNPIDFENAEGNLGIATALMEFFCRKLPKSRLQRDLSDSTVLRSFGTALGHCLLAYKSILEGFSKIVPNPTEIKVYLDRHPEMISEGIQTILRREGVPNAYEVLKDFTRGKRVSLENIREFIITLPVSDAVKGELLELSPQTYVGKAMRIV